MGRFPSCVWKYSHRVPHSLVSTDQEWEGPSFVVPFLIQLEKKNKNCLYMFLIFISYIYIGQGILITYMSQRKYLISFHIKKTQINILLKIGIEDNFQ